MVKVEFKDGRKKRYSSGALIQVRGGYVEVIDTKNNVIDGLLAESIATVNDIPMHLHQ